MINKENEIMVTPKKMNVSQIKIQTDTALMAGGLDNHSTLVIINSTR